MCFSLVHMNMWLHHEVSGEDRIQFLHNQTTANFECLHEGQVFLVGCNQKLVAYVRLTQFLLLI